MLKLVVYIFLLSIAGIAVIFIFFNYLLYKIFHIPHVKNEKVPEDFGLRVNDIRVPTRHNKRIQLWDLNPELIAPVILGVHGWANTSSELLKLGQILSQDWRVFLLNTRNHGESDSDKYSSLLKFSEDLIKTIDYISEQLEIDQPICLLGHSLGGAASLYTATLDQRVKAVIAIATFADLEETMRSGFMKQRMPESLIKSMLTYIEFRVGAKLKHLSPAYTISQFNRPTLLVHGTKDEWFNFTDLNKIMENAARANVSKLIMKGHSHNSLIDDSLLASEIDRFLKNNLMTKLP